MSETITPSDRPTIETERIFDAPRSLVYAAFTTLETIGQWWGPRGFTCRDNDWDFRVGGHWKFTMHHDERGDFPNIITYTEIVENELIAFDHGEDEIDPVHFTSRIVFSDEGEKTRLRMTMTFPSISERDEVLKTYGALEGQKETFDRLDEFLVSRK